MLLLARRAGDTALAVAFDGPVAQQGRGPLAEVWEVVRRSPLAGAPSTLLGVGTLGYEGQLVEIEAIAVVA